jgi:hypothetical protein
MESKRGWFAYKQENFLHFLFKNRCIYELYPIWFCLSGSVNPEKRSERPGKRREVRTGFNEIRALALKKRDLMTRTLGHFAF